MKRAEFFDKFPHMIELPEHPTCEHCWQQSFYQGRKLGDDLVIVLSESHQPACPLFSRHGSETELMRRTERSAVDALLNGSTDTPP